MLLSELFAAGGNGVIVAGGDPVVGGVTADSREVKPGYVFAAVAGVKTDGAKFIRDAVEKGAAALLLAKGQWEHADIPAGVAVVECESVRRALGEAVDALYRHPSASLELIGITGTNGKTTSAYLLRHIYNKAGRKAGMLGTIEYDYGDRRDVAPLTTPDAVTFTRALAEMRDAGCRAAVVETSSHALEQERVWPHEFSGAIFTNLSRDHLDYHGNMEAYLEAKKRLFTRLGKDAIAVVNFRDPAAPKVMEGTAAKVLPFVLHGADAPSRALPGNTCEADILASDLGGQTFRVRGNGIDAEFVTPLVGRHNVENCLGCVIMALGRGVPVETVQSALACFPGVPGRLERLESENGVKAFVDYSHTDDALRSVLSVLRPMVEGKLITVFGCGGDRDPGKRPMMAKAAEAFSDAIVATSDNPRTEDPEAILDDVMAGFEDREKVTREVERPVAVARAIAMAKPGDVVLVAGKGHEDYQIVGVEKRHMDDRELVREAFAKAGTV